MNYSEIGWKKNKIHRKHIIAASWNSEFDEKLTLFLKCKASEKYLLWLFDDSTILLCSFWSSMYRLRFRYRFLSKFGWRIEKFIEIHQQKAYHILATIATKKTPNQSKQNTIIINDYFWNSMKWLWNSTKQRYRYIIWR